MKCCWKKNISFRMRTGHIADLFSSFIAHLNGRFCSFFDSASSRLEMPKDEVANHNCIKHLRSVVQQQQTKIADLEKTAAEHKHQLAEQVRT